MQHSPTALLLYLGMTARALLAQAAASPDGLPRSPTAGPTRLPYVVRLHELDETAAVRLRDALAEIPGVEAVAALSGDERAVQVHARDGHFVSRAQVEDVVRRLRLALDAFEIPAWARMRFYVVEASGGG